VCFSSEMDLEQKHQYICNSLHAEVRVRTSDRFQPGPISGSADVLPFDWSFRILPHQYHQYQMLQIGIKSQQRFDTMLRQRPTDSPRKNPRAWWQYAIECVTSRPNSRPWEDVKKIAKSRRHYMDLVVKKNKARGEGGGYHAGLSESESAELLELEDLLPIEALTAFHLLALRQVYESEKQSDVVMEEEKSRPKPPPSSPEPHKSRSKGLGLFRLSSSRKRASQSGGGSGESEPLMGTTWDIYSDDDVVKRRMDQKISARKGNAPPRPPPDLVLDENLASEVTLLQAMTLRLGKKVWLIDWKLHDATVNLSIMQSYEEPAIAQMVMRARGDVRSFGKGKRDFWFDIIQCDVLHRETKVLFVRPAEEDRLTEDEDDKSESGMTAFDPFHEGSSLRRPGNQKLGGPDLLSSARYLDLPPGGVVCRIVAGVNASTKNFSISSHPATLIWTTSLFDGMSDFFFTRSENIQADLTQHIRNAATPLARKAQLALLSPASMALHLNIVAPKIWLPIAVKGPEGTLLLDAGVVRVAGNKVEGDTEMTWNLRGRDFQANFCKGRPLSLFQTSDHSSLMPPLGEAAARAESAIIRPFHISVDASTRPIPSKYDASSFLPEGGLVRDVGIHISPVCLNLVDGEVLARAFGKWYARSLHRVRRRVTSSREGKNNRSSKPVHQDVPTRTEADHIDQGSVPQRLSVRVEKVEMALEGHSKKPSDGDDRSLASQDSFHESSPPIRTYLVELRAIEVLRTSRDRTAATSLSVLDVSIVRLKDGSLYSPFKNCRQATDSEYCILVRSNPLPGPSELETKNGFPPADDRPRIIRTSLLHDGAKHLDEVEIDIDSVVLRVTPTTLKDCAKAVKRIVELAQLATKEMERKVHEEGRKARKRDRKPVSKYFVLLLPFFSCFITSCLHYFIALPQLVTAFWKVRLVLWRGLAHLPCRISLKCPTSDGYCKRHRRIRVFYSE
jgi:Vacuolar sorting-associated protein 13, N-terminal